MTWTLEKTQQTLAEIGRLAATDAAFRAAALYDPAAAVQQVAGEPLPDGFKLRLVENGGAHLTYVLPDPAPAGDEAAGGDFPTTSNALALTDFSRA